MAFCTSCGTELNAGGQFCAHCGAAVSDPGAHPWSTSGRPSAETIATHEQRLLALVRQATLGEYEILAEIGKGGMAVVYLGHDLALDRKVAIKVMAPALTLMDRGIQERFKREARTAASLSHPNIIPVYAVKESKDLVYFVMKYIAGRSLDSVIREVGPLPIPVVQTVLTQVGSAVGYAHRRGVIHRDLKPGNVMLDEEGWVVVADFGIAKVAQAEALTATGGMVGTPAYMSPEQCSGGEVTGASDQYSLGVMAFEMISGRAPFQSGTMVNMIYDHCHTPPPPLAQLRADCPPEVTTAVMRMLEKDPARRWPSVEEAAAAIGTVSATESEAARTKLSALVQPGSAASLLEKFRTPRSPVPLSAAAPRRPATPAGSAAAAPPAESPVPPSTPPAPGIGPLPAGAAPKRSVRQVLAWTLPAAGLALAIGGWLAIRGRTPAANIPPGAAVERPPAPARVDSPPVVARLDLTPLVVALEPEQQSTLRATARDAQGNEIAGVAVTWESADPRVATISPEGVVRAVRPGTTQVTARTSGNSAAAVVTVSRRAPAPTVATQTGAARPATEPAPPPVRETTSVVSPPPAPTPAVDTGRPAVPAAAPVPPPAPVPRVEDPRPAIERALEAYRRAIESRDLAQLRAAYPGLTREQERSWRDFFASVTELAVTLTIQRLDTQGDRAEGLLAVTYHFRARNRQTQNLELNATLERVPGGWQLTAIR